MGFDLTGLNPKNKKYKSPSNDLYENDKDKFFKELEKRLSELEGKIGEAKDIINVPPATINQE